MDDASSTDQRRQFGDFLRSRRERLTPGTVGLDARRRRRTPGLRREEVAELAGIGTDWYVRLEQGRDVSPSVTTIDALARVLRLSEAERAHLFSLGRSPAHRLFVRESVPDEVGRVIAASQHPAYVTGRRWDLLAWNAAAVEVFGDFGSVPEGERNILLYVLTDARARALFDASWETEAQRMVAQFRASHDLWAGDPAFIDLLDRLSAGCPPFPAWWDSHEIRAGGTGTKRLRHPICGPLDFTYATFQANVDPALKLALYVPLSQGTVSTDQGP